MLYQKKRCPHCGTIYEKNTYAGNPLKYARSKYGSPLKICAVCHLKFIDDEYIEIEVDGARRSDAMRISPKSIVFGIFALVLICFMIFHMENISPVNFIIPGIILLVFPLLDLVTYKSRMKKLCKEAEESKKRLQNPRYALELKKRGYDVPKEYLTLLNPHNNAENKPKDEQ